LQDSGETEEVSEPHTAKLSTDGRVNIPQDLAKTVQWLSGTKSLKAWVLVQSFGRHRLISQQEVESSPELSELRTEIASALSQSTGGPLSFEAVEKVVLPSRFFEVELRWSEKNKWRLTLSSMTIDLWRIQRGKGHVAILLSGGYLEIWSMDTLEGAFNTDLADM
jgi:hypothetical protein